jgi:transcriptional regulator with XRE-family HTH domain
MTTTKTPASPKLGFGPLLRAHRKACRIGLVDLAQAIGLDPALLSRVETGKRALPDLDVLNRCAVGLKIKPGSAEYRELELAAMSDLVFGLNGSKATTRNSASPSAGMIELAREVASAQPRAAQPSVELEFCSSVADLIGRATAYAVEAGATQITVESKSGEVRRFQVLTKTEDK